MGHREDLERLREFACAIGASRALVIPTSELVIKDSAWAKCFIPTCKFYGSSIMCPPHNPLKPEATRRIVREFRYGVLLQLDAPVEDFVGAQWRERHVPTEIKHKEIVAKVEGRAFYMGYTLAMGFAAGECSLCLPRQPCSVLQGKDCAHPLMARPAMEACGFDVFAIAQRVGWSLAPIGHGSRKDEVPCASLIGLVLVV